MYGHLCLRAISGVGVRVGISCPPYRVLNNGRAEKLVGFGF
jgi:hypothetical protein